MAGDGASLLAAIFGICKCSGTFSCQLDIDTYGILLWFAIMIYMFKALGTICDEYFVPSLEVIVTKLQLSNDVAGATFMAAGSSAPELFTSIVATFLIVNEGGVGTIIGSAIFNILVIVGLTGFIACKDQQLQIWWYPLTRDCSFYLLAIAELSIVLADEEVMWYEGLVLFLTYIVYCIYMKLNSHIVAYFGLVDPKDVTDASEDAAEASDTKTAPPGGAPATKKGEIGLRAVVPTEEEEEKISSTGGQRVSEEPATERPSEVGEQGSRTSSKQRPVSMSLQKAKSMDVNLPPTAENAEEPEPEGWTIDPLNLLWKYTMPSAENHCWILFSAAVGFIAACTYIMVDATNRFGCNLHIPPFVMGLIFLAAGTSIPDALGSIAVAKQGEGDMAIANALGSNVFDILLGLGVPWFVSGLFGKKVCFPGASKDLAEYIVILVVVLLFFVGALVVNQWRLTRSIGAILMLFYLVYVTYTLLSAFVFDPIDDSDTDTSECR